MLLVEFWSNFALRQRCHDLTSLTSRIGALEGHVSTGASFGPIDGRTALQFQKNESFLIEMEAASVAGK